MSAGSPRGVTIDGIPFNVTGDANIALNPRITKESIPHSGGNMVKLTTEAGNVEAVKLTVTPAEYDILRGISEQEGDIPMSYVMADGSSFKSPGQVMIGPYQTDDSSCEVQFLTSTGTWEIFAAS
ncbi:MAG: hypothetical protein V3T82_01345 [Nitrospinaceae bacterium]